MNLKLFLSISGVMLATAAAAAAPVSPYTLASVTPVAAMPEGDWDQLVADIPHNRIYVSAEDGDAIDVFDLRTGALVNTAPLASPHKAVFDSAKQHLLVADGKDGTVQVMTPDLKVIKSIPVGAKPDAGVLDDTARIFYVGSRDGDATAAMSRISAISLDTLEVTRVFKVPAMVLKGLIEDKIGKRLFVSMRDQNAIGVVHTDTGQVEVLRPDGLKMNVPNAYDGQSQYLFSGSREPGRLTVIDTRSGKSVDSLPATETADSMSFDAAHRILYVSGDTGMSRYRIAADGKARWLETDPALVGKSSLYVAELRRLYVMRPKKGAQVAALQIFDVR